jgi:hypothetical protein
LLALITAGAFATTALAQCESGFYIKWDADAFAYEDNYNPATFISSPGSQLVVVGIVSQFCAPFQDLDASDPTTEYTFVFAGLTSAGTVVTNLGPAATKFQTDYGQGVFLIFQDTPRDAPDHTTMPPNPPVAGVVPDRFIDGTAILQGDLYNFVTTVTRSNNGPGTTDDTFVTSFRANYQFTGPGASIYYQRVQGSLQDIVGGAWCAKGTNGGLCDIPEGYSSHPNGKFDGPPVTAVRSSTWGAIKQTYR